MNTKDKGDIAELAVALDLISKGYKIALPFGENWRFDLLATLNCTEFLKIQVKYTTPKNGVLLARCSSTTKRRNGETFNTKYSEEEIDYIAVYDSINKDCYYIPSSKFLNKNIISLRLNSTLNNNKIRINFAKDYIQL